MQNKPLADKVVLITGGARRIGASIARLLHEQGMRLVIHYRSSADSAHELQAELNGLRENSVVLVRGDLLDVAKLSNLVLETLNTYSRLDVLVNNASTFYPTPIGKATEKQWNDLVGTNLKAPFFLAQAAAPALRESGGCIVNLADIYTQRPLTDHPIYVCAKGAVVSLTRALARDLAPEVRVNAVAPGAILWPENDGDEVAQQRIVSRTPLKRLGAPEDIAKAVVYLVQDAPYVTGQILSVDGGRSVVL